MNKEFYWTGKGVVVTWKVKHPPITQGGQTYVSWSSSNFDAWFIIDAFSSTSNIASTFYVEWCCVGDNKFNQ